jgi:hypothetical protein
MVERQLVVVVVVVKLVFAMKTIDCLSKIYETNALLFIDESECVAEKTTTN